VIGAAGTARRSPRFEWVRVLAVPGLERSLVATGGGELYKSGAPQPRPPSARPRIAYAGAFGQCLRQAFPMGTEFRIAEPGPRLQKAGLRGRQLTKQGAY
jgi:hypothetical protein